MAKKPKNKKPAVVATVEDVSKPVTETLSIPAADQGKVPVPGVLPEEHESAEEALSRFVEDADAGKLRLPGAPVKATPMAVHDEMGPGDKLIIGNSLKATVGVTPPSDEPDLRGQVAVDAGKATDAIIGVQTKVGGPYSSSELVGKVRELVPDAMETSDDPVAKFNDAIVVAPRGSKVEPLQTGSKEWSGQPLRAEGGDATNVLAKIDTRVIGGTFKTDALKALVSDDCGFQVGKLYLFAFNADNKNAGDISAWLDNNIEWSLPDQVDFYYFNQSSERAHVRNYREKSVRDNRIAIGILSVPSHCLMITPHHIPHSMEADGVFAFSGSKLTREKYRGETSERMDAHREVTL